MKICCLVNIFANLTCKMKAPSTPNMERQHLKFHELANVFTRVQTSTRALLGQPSPQANNYKQLSFLDPLLFHFQISKALSELATTRHTHTHTHTQTQTHQHTYSHTHVLTYTDMHDLYSKRAFSSSREAPPQYLGTLETAHILTSQLETGTQTKNMSCP